MGSTEESEVVMLGWWLSMFTSRVRIALAEKGIKYKYLEEDIRNKSPLLLKHNPVHKLVPVLIHNGKSICESKIILHYINEAWKDGTPLLPSDPYLKSQAGFWADYVDKKIYDGSKRIWSSKGEEMQKGGEDLIGYLKVLEGELGNKPYFMGESFGYLDIVLICYYNHFYAYGILGKFSIKKECPKLFDWATKCMERESVSEALTDPKRIYDTLIEYRKNVLGFEDWSYGFTHPFIV